MQQSPLFLPKSFQSYDDLEVESKLRHLGWLLSVLKKLGKLSCGEVSANITASECAVCNKGGFPLFLSVGFGGLLEGLVQQG